MKNKPKAFSLIEMIIYVGITSMILVSIMLFSVKMIELRGESEFQREVYENASFVMSYLSREVRDANSVSGGVFDVNPSSIIIVKDDASLLEIRPDSKVVGANTITYLLLDDGVSNTQMTSDKINVQSFTINDLSRGSEIGTYQIVLVLESLDGTEDISLQTTVTTRE